MRRLTHDSVRRLWAIEIARRQALASHLCCASRIIFAQSGAARAAALFLYRCTLFGALLASTCAASRCIARRSFDVAVVRYASSNRFGETRVTFGTVFYLAGLELARRLRFAILLPAC